MASDSKAKPEGFAADIRGIIQLVKSYALQETVDPLKRAASYVGLGLAGSFLMSMSALFFSLSALRGMQEQSAFEGDWSFAPYVIVAFGLVIMTFIVKSVISSGGEK